MNELLYNINVIFGIFLPSLLIVIKENRKEYEKNELIYILINYVNYLFLINIICYFISIYIFKKDYFIFTNVFTLKYECLAYVIGLIIYKIKATNIISKIFLWLHRNIIIKVRIEKNENKKIKKENK